MTDRQRDHRQRRLRANDQMEHRDQGTEDLEDKGSWR
jgi:hypothetical protein